MRSCNHPALAVTTHLDFRLCVDARERLPADTVESVGEWSHRLGEPGPGGNVDRVQRVPLDASQVGHQRKVVFRPPLPLALDGPAADPTVLDRFPVSWKQEKRGQYRQGAPRGRVTTKR